MQSFNTEPHKTLSKRQLGEFHNEITSKGDCKESNLNNNCEKVTTKSSNENDKSDTKSKIELRLKIKRLKNKLDKLTIENRFLREENLSLSLLYFSSNTTPFIDNWTKGSRCGSSKEIQNLFDTIYTAYVSRCNTCTCGAIDIDQFVNK